MLVIALTGGIGCGKSAVSKHLEALGTPVLDADQLARQMVLPGSPALNEIIQAFGHHLLNADGTLKRAELRKLIFNNDHQRRHLESILHPRIRQAMDSWLKQQTAPYAVLVIPLLFETHQQTIADRVLVVDCDESIQISRVKDRDNLTDDQIRKILASQVNRKTRLAGADDVIENSGSLDDLVAATDAMHKYYLELAKS
jgi:dephospho-CoA kinase